MTPKQHEKAIKSELEKGLTFVKNQNKASEDQQDTIETKITKYFHYFIATVLILNLNSHFSLKNVNVELKKVKRL